jgi:hypothetical protein
MNSPRTITLFEEHPDLHRPPASFAVSILIHAAVIALVTFAILYTPRIDHRIVMGRLAIRQLDLDMPDQHAHRSAANDLTYPGPWPKNRAPSSSGKSATQPVVLPQIPNIRHGLQTILQPDLHTDITLPQLAPVPQVVLWTPASKPVAKIVAPQPAKPPAAIVRPTLQTPNQETNLADISISSVPLPSLKQTIAPSTTTPLVVQSPKPVPSTPATVSQPSAKPTPAAVVSLSDVRMKSGTVTLPPVNETTATDAAGAFSLAPGPAKTLSAPGNGNPANQGAGNGPETGKAATGKAPGTQTGTEVAGTPTASGAGSRSPVAGSGQTPGLQPQGGDTGQDQGDAHTVTQIALPKDGQFGAVIVGASIQDQYPEISDVWKGRMAYTVYLHVGLEKSWILQYSLPRSGDASEAGAIAQLQAPWPYNIVRPNLAPDSIDSDALMIHGYVNDTGHFETLSVVFPPQFPQAKFVLDSLEHWQFRPASQNGQVAKVEVLLIIPEEFE